MSQPLPPAGNSKHVALNSDEQHMHPKHSDAFCDGEFDRLKSCNFVLNPALSEILLS